MIPYVKFVMIFNAIGVCQLYLNIFHTVFRTFVVTILANDPSFGIGWFFDVKYFVVPIAGLCLLPFAFQKSTDGLKFASWVCVIASVIFITSIIVAFSIKVHSGDIEWSNIGWFWTTNGGNQFTINNDTTLYGEWGGNCLCPNGESYWVSSLKKNSSMDLNNCESFGCGGGTVLETACRKFAGNWSWTKVQCDQTGNYSTNSLVSIASHLPQICMAYTFQFNFFAFYKSLDGSNDKKMLNITGRALFSVFMIYWIVSFLGYVTFGNSVQGKILDNLNTEKNQFGVVFLGIINFSFMFLSALGFPMLFFNCRNFCVSVAMDIWNCFNMKKGTNDGTSLQAELVSPELPEIHRRDSIDPDGNFVSPTLSPPPMLNQLQNRRNTTDPEVNHMSP